MTSKVLSVLQCLSDRQVGKVLVTEGDDLALDDEAGEFVFAGVGEGGELDAGDFGTDGWSQVDALRAHWEEIFEGEVDVFAVTAGLLPFGCFQCITWTYS